MKSLITWLSLTLALSAACVADTAPASPDGRDEVGITAGKADGSAFNDCELEAVVVWVNDPGTSAETLKDAGVHGRAANNIIDHRNGPDGLYGTPDDQPFEDVVQIDDVWWVGPVAIQQLVAAIADRCVDGAAADIEVIFSPQPYWSSHLVRTASLIDDAERSVDVAMYSFRDNGIFDSLVEAVDRGVTVRVLFDGASEDRRDPAGTMSARLEDAGMEVRWVNKIMHHKFAIIDGVRTETDDAIDGTLVTGSGNWSHSAGTKYEENTLVVRRHPELLARFQREFNHLWAHSREVIWNESIEYFESLPITEDRIIDDPAADVAFTSDNFRTYFSSRYGHTFSSQYGERNVVEKMVELIEDATTSIHLASGHLRSRPVAEAIMAKAEANPSMDIRVYLDGQEWISDWYQNNLERDLELCLSEADTDREIDGCMYGGYYFSKDVHDAGIPIRFKYYAYRWSYHYAEQMHHKYMVIDGRILATGSYNLSDNAETNTMENLVILDGAEYPDLVQAFEDEFERMWVTGRDGSLYEDLLDHVQNGSGPIDIVFDSMALDWGQVDVLKDAIREACPDVNTEPFRSRPQDHRVCYR